MSTKSPTFSVTKSGNCYGIYSDGTELMTSASADDLAFAVTRLLSYLSWIQKAAIDDWGLEEHEMGQLEYILDLTKEAIRDPSA